MDDHPKRIGNISAGLMISVALIFDAIQTILTFIGIGIIVGPFISLWSFLTFFTWFKIKGVTFIDRAGGKKVAAWAGTFLLEAIPGLNSLPGITIATIATIIFTRIEDRTLSKEQQQQLLALIQAIRNAQIKQAARTIKEAREYKRKVDDIRQKQTNYEYETI